MQLGKSLATPDITKIKYGPIKDYLRKLVTTLENQHRLIHNDLRNQKFGNVQAGNYLGIDSSGHLTLYGDATVFDDNQVNISNIRVPAVNDPTERLYNHGIGGGVTFPVLGFAVNDYIYFDIQTYHSMKLNTILDNHIHFVLPNTTNVGDKFQFQLDVIAAGIGGTWAVPTGSPFTSEHTIVADDNTKHRLMEIADIPASNTTVSSIYSCKMTRIAASGNEYGSEVYMKFNDSHAEKNTIGSNTESAK